MKQQLSIKSVDQKSIYLYSTFLKKTFKYLNFKYKYINLPTKKKRITLLKSPHVNKKSREQFELKKYKITFIINNLIINDKILTLLLINKPKTIKITIKTLGR